MHAAVDPEVKPHRLSSLYIHHAASYDRGISPADAPSYNSPSSAATLSHAAAARTDGDDMVTLPARFATAAAFLAPRALSAYRVVGSHFVHPAQHASHVAASANATAAADEAAMQRSSLDDAVENAFFGTHEQGLQDMQTHTQQPAVDSKYAGHIMADPDTKAAIRRAERERAKAEAAEREMQVWPLIPNLCYSKFALNLLVQMNCGSFSCLHS